MAMGGRLGAKIDLNAIPKQGELSDIETLFSESNTRFVVTCAKEDVAKLAKIFEGLPFAQVGETTADQNLVLGDVSIPLDEMVKSYKTTLDHI